MYSARNMKLDTGTRLGVYEITGELGAGGMGEVYRARDTRLGRDVAIKVLPAALSDDAERLARFEREAQLLAALDHPNIARVHGLDEADGTRFLAMELAGGEDLSQLIGRGPIATDDAVAIARQIADGLESAHERSIIHRDLKPANVKVGPNGDVKILDFGLARAYEDQASATPAQLSQSPTITNQLTTPGVILGTAAYMSPEQARGRAVDRRADIWAFGVILFEMLTGESLFKGESVSEVLAAVIKDRPDFGRLPKSVPAHVRRLIERCLEQDPRQRLRDIGEARIALESGEQQPTESADAGGASVSPTRWILIATLVAFAAAAIAWTLKPEGGSTPLRTLDLIAEGVDWDWSSMPTLSPDGSRIAYSANERLWVRNLDEVEARPLADLEEASNVFWSPDGESIAFENRRRLWRIAASGGSPVPICEIPETGSIIGGAWGTDDQIVISVWRGAMYEVPAVSGTPSVMFPHDPDTEVDYHWPSLMPNGHLIFATHWREDVEATGPRPTLEVFDGDTRHAVEPASGGSEYMPTVTPDGYMVFLRGRQTTSARDIAENQPSLWAARFDAASRKFTSEPVLLAANAYIANVSRDGSLLYVEGAGSETIRELGWLDRDGEWLETISKPHPELADPTLAPDDRQIVFHAGQRESGDLWLLDAARGVETRLTFSEADERWARWLPDGKRVAFAARTDMVQDIRVLSIAGSSTSHTLDIEGVVGREAREFDVTPDGTRLAVVRDERGRGRLYVTSIAGASGGELELLLPDPQPDVDQPRISPDGRLIAYVVYDSGQPEVFLSRFPEGTGRWQVTLDGGRFPAWSRSGELFFMAGSGPRSRALTSVAVDADRNPVADSPVALFPVNVQEAQGFDVSSDGQRFLVPRRSGADRQAPRRMILVQNWQELMGR